MATKEELFIAVRNGSLNAETIRDFDYQTAGIKDESVLNSLARIASRGIDRLYEYNKTSAVEYLRSSLKINKCRDTPTSALLLELVNTVPVEQMNSDGLYFVLSNMSREVRSTLKAMQSGEILRQYNLEQPPAEALKFLFSIKEDDEALMELFNWKGTKEGFHYWADLANSPRPKVFFETLVRSILNVADERTRKAYTKELNDYIGFKKQPPQGRDFAALRAQFIADFAPGVNVRN